MTQQRRIWVVKVGSSLVTAGGQGVDEAQLHAWAADIATLRTAGIEVVWVSSGAIAEGMHIMQQKKRPEELPQLQATAAIGQVGLVRAYERALAPYQIHTAQILLTHDDMKNRTRYLNARATLRSLLAMDVLPIINENDTVSTGEIKLGDNDTLGALVANLMEAEMLVILTDQDGLYTADPRHDATAKKINQISALDAGLEKMAGGAGSAVGTGGMLTKVRAARRAALSGTATCIASGKEERILTRLLAGEALGSLLLPGQNRMNARRQWLMGQLHLSGQISVDRGAAVAMVTRHSSLLPVGCVAVAGEFLRGEVVQVIDEAGQEIARGLVNYNSEEISRLLHSPSDQIASHLGYRAEDEVMHRDNMVVTAAISDKKMEE